MESGMILVKLSAQPVSGTDESARFDGSVAVADFVAASGPCANALQPPLWPRAATGPGRTMNPAPDRQSAPRCRRPIGGHTERPDAAPRAPIGPCLQTARAGPLHRREPRRRKDLTDAREES